MDLAGKYLYFGNLLPNEPQYANEKWVGLALHPRGGRDIKHDATHPLPVPDNSVAKIQSQDVFEHIDDALVPAIFDDIYRALAPGGVFRLSMPDYNSPLLLRRSAFNEKGEVIGDLAMGARVFYDDKKHVRIVEFAPGGDSHVWFPTYDKVQALIAKSRIKTCAQILVRHAFTDRTNYIVEAFPEDEMPVQRRPPNDMRSGGAPISIIVDFVK